MRDSGYVAVRRKRVTYDALERVAIRLSAAGMLVGLYQDYRTGEVQVWVDGEKLDHKLDGRDHWSAYDAIKALARGSAQQNPTDPMHEELKVRARGKAWTKEAEKKTKKKRRLW